MADRSSATDSGRNRRVPGLSALSGRVSDDLSALAHNVRALPEAVEYLRKLAESIDSIADDTARMRAATERMETGVIELNERFEAVEHSVHDLARTLRPIRTRRRARERASNERGKERRDAADDEPEGLPTPEGS